MTNYRYHLIIASAFCIMLLGALAFGIYRYVELDKESDGLAKAQAESIAHIEELEERLADAQTNSQSLGEALALERAKTGSFERQINDISGTVGTLAKLARTDPELLAKYSKVYFLNENYVPSSLSPIDSDYVSDSSRALEIHGNVAPHLAELLEEAKEDGIELRIVSAYRSFGTQAALKGNYVVSYGAGANRFSADQGYSEHQLGTTLDFTTPALGSSFTSFGSTEAYTWLTKNAHRYGFVLSYPEGNKYYMYEPWHWRYVGQRLATHLNREEKQFYDLDQREINEYLVDLFD